MKKTLLIALLTVFSQATLAGVDSQNLLKQISALRSQYVEQVKNANDDSGYRNATQLVDYMDTLEMEAKASIRSLDRIEKDLATVRASTLVKE